MRIYLPAALLFSILISGSISAQRISQDTLPDNHLLITLNRLENRMEGGSEYLEGFLFSMILPPDTSGKGPDSETLISLVRNQVITGILTYPAGKKTTIYYEVVDHRGKDDIYMKTDLGYFLWDDFAVSRDRIEFVIDWWYCPPASKADIEILEMAASLLADSTNWNRSDDRKCEDDMADSLWSLFCALKHASLTITGEYNHHNTAMQAVRSVIGEMVFDNEFGHPLMDFNNAPETGHADIILALSMAKDRIRQELKKNIE